MKKPSLEKRSQRAALAYEECLLHILGCVSFSPLQPNGLADAERQKLKQFDSKPERLSLEAYQKLVGKLIQKTLVGHPLLHGWQSLLEREFLELLSRYEHLLFQVKVGRATPRQVQWAICVRFFIPWAALRIAFHFRHSNSDGTGTATDWFLPTANRSQIGSCFMRILDQQVCRRGETKANFAARLCGGTQFEAGDSIAANMSADLRRYRAGTLAPSDAKLRQILEHCPAIPGLDTKLVLARAVDRNVRAAIKAFGGDGALKLIKYFTLSYRHFNHILQQLDAELPKDGPTAWQRLQSRTYTGNFPFEAERYHPLTEPYLSSLAQNISTELETAHRSGQLAPVPTSRRDFRGGRFQPAETAMLPTGIHEAVRNGAYTAAIAASQKTFQSGCRSVGAAVQTGTFFADVALWAIDGNNTPGPLIPDKNDAPMVLQEAARLLNLAYENSEGVLADESAIRYLRFLLAPNRPKARDERLLARKLYQIAAKRCSNLGHTGSARFLHGLLLWLEGEEAAALRAFKMAVKCGKATCTERDWIQLLRYALLLSETMKSKRSMNFFRKIADSDGVTHGEAAPRTSQFAKALKLEKEKFRFSMKFQPFPK